MLTKIQDLVKEGKLRLVLAVGVPRGGTTVFQRILTESPDITVQLDEPFYYKENGFNKGLANILKRYKEFSSTKDSKPITLLVQEMANSLNHQEWDELLKLSYGCIVLIRDMHRTCESLVIRTINDSIAKGLDTFVQLEVEQKLLFATKQLLDTTRYVKGSFSKTSWKALGEFIQYAEKHKSHIKFAFVDSDFLIIDTENILRDLAEKLEISYVNSMLQGWGKTSKNFWVNPEKDARHC
ncbi:hypothetical protein Cyrtocomes_01028 [Candidatus Cyrtobacter comes]|uniref:Sulfotransferase domain-containing protein n=1 Tax=Candidatus Cyrtobacter comes TaxID=675776 RepID=A0ABU5L9B9_9RICK|nr:hypothetical protein [Candidatus Cyrtobacter comes]MDZ5762637.1 hypothetical protein [Candidatus Cyrtobacter comes]